MATRPMLQLKERLDQRSTESHLGSHSGDIPEPRCNLVFRDMCRHCSLEEGSGGDQFCMGRGSQNRWYTALGRFSA